MVWKKILKKILLKIQKKICLIYISKEYDIQNIYGISMGKNRNPNLKNVISLPNTFDEK